jgi:hypothetical protein
VTTLRRRGAGAACIALLMVAMGGCGGEPPVARPPVRPPKPASSIVRPVPFPFGTDTVAPAVTSDADGAVLVSWIDRRAHALNIARWRDGRWFQPRTIARGDLAVSKANAPALFAAHGVTVAEWIEHNGKGTAIRVSLSNDGAASWSEPVTPHPNIESQFGFVSFAVEPDGGIGVVWLDGRNLEGGREGAGDMELRYAKIDEAGNMTSDQLLDPRVCDCCQTTIASTANGPVVLYRDRSADEIRDISVILKSGDGWTKPKPLRRDGWHIRGCPVNGPRADAAGLNVVAAWYSAANDQPRVNVAFSRDGGATFADPIRVDGGHPAGHVDVALLADGSAVVTWIENQEGNASIQATRVRRDRGRGSSVQVARVPAASSAGFPRIAISKDNIVVAWSGDPAGVRLALLHIPDL